MENGLGLDVSICLCPSLRCPEADPCDCIPISLVLLYLVGFGQWEVLSGIWGVEGDQVRMFPPQLLPWGVTVDCLLPTEDHSSWQTALSIELCAPDSRKRFLPEVSW